MGQPGDDRPPPTLDDAVARTLTYPGFLPQFNRLHGTRIAIRELTPRAPIERMIDDATGAPPIIWTARERDLLFSFVHQFVFMPVIDEFLTRPREA